MVRTESACREASVCACADAALIRRVRGACGSRSRPIHHIAAHGYEVTVGAAQAERGRSGAAEAAVVPCRRDAHHASRFCGDDRGTGGYARRPDAEDGELGALLRLAGVGRALHRRQRASNGREVLRGVHITAVPDEPRDGGDAAATRGRLQGSTRVARAMRARCVRRATLPRQGWHRHGLPPPLCGPCRLHLWPPH